MINLLAIPWVTLLLWLLAASSIMPIAILSSWLLALAEGLFTHGWAILAWLAERAPLWSLHLDAWQLLLLAMAVLIALMPRGLAGRPLALLILLTVIGWQPAALTEGAYRVTVLDVGQGLAMVIQTRGHTLVYDTGPRYSERFDSGRQVIVPFLRQRRLSRVDRLVVSHGDNDHRGGTVALRSLIPVNRVYTSVPRQIPGALPCHRGQSWRWDGVQFQMLHPDASRDLTLKGNNRSCILLIRGPGGSVLLTGDIEAEAEQRLLQRYPAQLRADILMAPHHGSNTSSTRSFIAAVAPRYVVFSTGYRNRYGFPHPQVVGRYRQIDANTLNTAHSGAIDFLIRPSSALQYSEFRQTHRRLWSFEAPDGLLE